jgi:hypothetical protein
MTTVTADPTACAECHARLTSCETKRWLSGRACCDGCNHPPPETPVGWDRRRETGTAYDPRPQIFLPERIYSGQGCPTIGQVR